MGTNTPHSFDADGDGPPPSGTGIVGEVGSRARNLELVDWVDRIFRALINAL